MDSEEIIDTNSEFIYQSSDSTIQNLVDHLTIPPSITDPSHQDIQSMSTNDPQTSSGQSNNWSNIPKLTSSTFFDWKRRLETTLGARRLSSHILEDRSVPTDENARADYIVDDLQALEAIQFSCESDNFNVISECSTARSAYLALCKYHDDSGGVTTANLFSELASTRLSSVSNLKEHLLKFRNVHTELKGNLRSTPELRISDPFIAILLLKSLPVDFNSLVKTSLANFESLTLDRVYTLLNMEAKRISGQSNEDSALITSAPRLMNKSKKKDQLKCSLGHLGHTDDICGVRLQNELDECKKQLSQQKITEQAKTATVPIIEDSHPSYYDHAFFTSSTDHSDEVYNTGATSHMSPNLEIFTSSTPIKPRPIGVAAKGSSVWADRIGTVSIGRLNLDHVLYSKGLTSTLISVGQLCDSGYRAIFTRTRGYILDSSGEIITRMI